MSEFPLSYEPVDYQLTVHIGNLLHNHQISEVYKQFKKLAEVQTEFSHTGDLGFHVKQLCSYYGKDTVLEFVKQVFNTKAA